MKPTDMDIEKPYIEKIFYELKDLNSSLSKKLDCAIISRDKIIKILGWICTVNILIGITQIIVSIKACISIGN